MTTQKITDRCTSRLGMSLTDAQWVAEKLYDYAIPDFSEWSWAQIDECLRDVLWFKGKTDVEIGVTLA